MGLSFTNVQVFSGGLSRHQARIQIQDTVQQWAGTQGYTAVGDEKQAARKVLIGPETSPSWIPVYDEATEEQDISQLEALAAVLSTTAGKAAIAILVHDSDLLELSVFRHGVRTSKVSNWPGYFAGSPPAAAPKVTGKGLADLRDFLVGEATILNLQEVWRDPASPERAIQILREMSPLLGWDPGLPVLGFRSLPAALRASAEKLFFRAAAQEVLSSGPPALGHSGGTGPGAQIRAGGLVSLTMVAHSTGGASKGLTLTVWGPALDRRLIDPDQATLLVGPPETGVLTSVSLDPVKSASGLLRTATLADFQIPRGIADPATAFKQAAAQFDQGLQAWMSTRIEVRLQTQAISPATGDVHIGLVPQENPDGGWTSWSTRLKIVPAP